MSDHTLADLRPDPRNARKHNPRNIGMIEQALQEVGAARSIVVDEDGTVLAGNATVEAARKAGINRVRIIDADGDTIIAVRRRNLTPEQKQRLALFDNRAGELAEWDEGVLADIAAENEALLAEIFNEQELDRLIPPEADYLEDFPSYGDDIETEYCCPSCGYEWSGQPK